MKTDKVITSFQVDYRKLVEMQKLASRLGFRSWGEFVRVALEEFTRKSATKAGVAKPGNGRKTGAL